MSVNREFTRARSAVAPTKLLSNNRNYLASRTTPRRLLDNWLGTELQLYHSYELLDLCPAKQSGS